MIYYDYALAFKNSSILDSNIDYWESKRAGWNLGTMKGSIYGVDLKSDNIAIFSNVSLRITCLLIIFSC